MISNPFATKFIRAGSMPYLFVNGHSIEAMFGQLVTSRMRGQIVGPHGTGKSTLLKQMVQQFKEHTHQKSDAPLGESFMAAQLGQGIRRLPWSWFKLIRTRPGTLLVIDGYEQLSLWRRISLQTVIRLRRLGLLITTHETQWGLPVLIRTHADVPTTRAIVDRLLADQSTGQPQPDLSDRELRQLLDSCGGNTREVLFQLFDRWQSGFGG